MKKIEEILNFWFKGLNDSCVINKNVPPASLWFVKNPAFDDEIRTNFEADLIKAKTGEYDDWAQTPAGRMALVLLFDQFPRNIYRNTPGMFATDPQALHWTLASLQDNRDQALDLIERVFLYMPLMHSEKLNIQRFGVEYFELLVSESKIKSPSNTPYFEYNLTYSKRHFAIIERFGRFPHRNAILGRTSTPEELEFLQTPGSGF